MARNEKKYHPDFIKYMNFIINHPNYKGLPIKKNKDGGFAWIAPKTNEIGFQRIKWCEEKALELGFDIEPGVYSKVMREIHPTKMKPCQICGKVMSIYYYYPTNSLLTAIKKRFKTEYTQTEHISDIWDDLLKKVKDKKEVEDFFLEKINLKNEIYTKEQIITVMETFSRCKGKKLLSPGTMSNFPDRFDGFHSYNLCCRSKEDKGRSASNLKTYSKDRRAYEYWSDGNIHAANQFMGSSFFNNESADHIGPISLGFIHDSLFLQPMNKNENSSKRDRLQLIDIEKIIEIERKNKLCAMSWYSKRIWLFIKENYLSNKDKIETLYRDTLKQNISNYMYILWSIYTKCNNYGKIFLEDAFLKPNYDYYKYSYKFNKQGEIIEKSSRHITDRNTDEMERYKRIAYESLIEFHEKENRKLTFSLTYEEQNMLDEICLKIEKYKDLTPQKQLIQLIERIEERLISELKS